MSKQQRPRTRNPSVERQLVDEPTFARLPSGGRPVPEGPSVATHLDLLASPDLAPPLKTIVHSMQVVNHPVVAELQRVLEGLEGVEFGSFEANDRFAKSLTEILRRLGLRLACNSVPRGRRSECGRPAILVAKPYGEGSSFFSFRHQLPDLQTDHKGTKALPKLRLTAQRLPTLRIS